MDIDYALMADAAEIANGKLYVLGGGWDTYSAAEVPAQLRVAIAVGVRIGWEETNQQTPVRVTIEDDDGQQLVAIDGAVNVGRPAGLSPGSTQLAQMAVNLAVNFQKHGGYRVRIVAGSEERSVEKLLPFRVLPRKS